MHTFKSFIAESNITPKSLKLVKPKFTTKDSRWRPDWTKQKDVDTFQKKLKEEAEQLDELKVPHPTFLQKHLLGVRSLRDVAKTVHTMPHHELQSLHKSYEKNPPQSIVQAQQHRSIKKALRRYGDAQGTHKPLDKSKFVKKDLHEEEQLDELKSTTLGNYVVTAAGDLRHQSAADAKYQKDYAQSKDPAVKKALGALILKKTHNINKRRAGIERAIKSLTKKDHMVSGTGELRKLKKR